MPARRVTNGTLTMAINLDIFNGSTYTDSFLVLAVNLFDYIFPLIQIMAIAGALVIVWAAFECYERLNEQDLYFGEIEVQREVVSLSDFVWDEEKS